MAGELDNIEKEILEGNKRRREKLTFYLDKLIELQADFKKSKVIEPRPTSSETTPSPKVPSPRSP
ncbi:MAG TPA: hypothetical protein VGV92_04090 [Gammaproteobacteria bacterium]|nr:hypothetical protein [Gammaproteobacteria bacterium]